MTVSSRYNVLENKPEDPIANVINKYNNDSLPQKIDCSIGVYKDGLGQFYTFPCIEQAKKQYIEDEYDFNYHTMMGLADFTKNAQTVLFDEPKSNVITIQTVGGTNALHVGFSFAKQLGFTDFYLGVPAWSNYQGMIEHLGVKCHTYNYLKDGKASVDNVLQAIDQANANSVFILQACCHNPTASDYSHEDWEKIVKALQSNKVFPLIDIAYQGFASGSLEKDSWIIKYLYSLNMEFITCQSFSKNLGLYSERLGACHIITQDATNVPTIKANLLSIFRHENSFAPTFGARLCNIVNLTYKSQWYQDLQDCHQRLINIRQEIYNRLKKLNSPGNWKNIINQNGMFWWTELTEAQVDELMNTHHIYCTNNGRVNIAGLHDGTLDYFIESLDKVLRL